ncbi:MAG: hypothetical protein ACLFSB_09545 [Chitinispirillaceae bacterium]
MNYYLAAKKVLFSKQYYITAKIIPISGYVGASAHIVFYFLCVAQGYWESFILRLIMAALWVPFLLFPRSKNLKAAHKCYWETALFISLPLFFCYMFLKNEFVTYWYISLLWACMIYGIMAGKAYIPMVLKTGTRSMLQKGLEFYFKKGSMVEAAEVFLQILKQTPQHNYIKDRKMDEISRYFAFRCLKWLSNPDQFGDALNLMEGCYDFASDNLPRDWYRLTTDEIVQRLEYKKNSKQT